VQNSLYLLHQHSTYDLEKISTPLLKIVPERSDSGDAPFGNLLQGFANLKVLYDSIHGIQ
jgi:hypothetical protein